MVLGRNTTLAPTRTRIVSDSLPGFDPTDQTLQKGKILPLSSYNSGFCWICSTRKYRRHWQRVSFLQSNQNVIMQLSPAPQRQSRRLPADIRQTVGSGLWWFRRAPLCMYAAQADCGQAHETTSLAFSHGNLGAVKTCRADACYHTAVVDPHRL